MAESIIRCPECETRLKVPAGKSAVRCPKCATKFPVPVPDAPPAAKRPPRRDADDEPDERDDDRPRRRRARDEEDDDRPRRRRARDEEDDAPRRPRRRARGSDDGPWMIVAAVVPVCFLLTFGGAFAIYGSAGLPPGQDGPGGKLAGLGIGFLVSLVLIGMGIAGVKNRRAYGKWGIVIEGTLGVITATLQAVLGGLFAGFTLYGLIFTLVNGR